MNVIVNRILILCLIAIIFLRGSLTYQRIVMMDKESFTVLLVLVVVFFFRKKTLWFLGLVFCLYGVYDFIKFGIDAAEPTSFQFTSIVRFWISSKTDLSADVIAMLFWSPLIFYIIGTLYFFYSLLSSKNVRTNETRTLA